MGKNFQGFFIVFAHNPLVSFLIHKLVSFLAQITLTSDTEISFFVPPVTFYIFISLPPPTSCVSEYVDIHMYGLSHFLFSCSYYYIFSLAHFKNQPSFQGSL